LIRFKLESELLFYNILIFDFLRKSNLRHNKLLAKKVSI